MSDIKGTRMAPEPRTARAIFEELFADRERPRFGFGAKLALINVDLQNAYTDISRFETAYETDPRQIELVNRLAGLTRAKGMPVVWTRAGQLMGGAHKGVWALREEGSGGGEAQEDRHDIDPRCDVDWQRDAVYTKSAPSAFFDTPLTGWLTFCRVDTVVLTGGGTSNCLRATAVDAISHGYRTIIPLECAADRDENAHFANLTDLDRKYADVEPVQTVIDWLERQPDA
jgi:maleamate amidohydrolase